MYIHNSTQLFSQAAPRYVYLVEFKRKYKDISKEEICLFHPDTRFNRIYNFKLFTLRILRIFQYFDQSIFCKNNVGPSLHHSLQAGITTFLCLYTFCVEARGLPGLAERRVWVEFVGERNTFSTIQNQQLKLQLAQAMNYSSFNQHDGYRYRHILVQLLIQFKRILVRQLEVRWMM